jgi:predicted transposase YbfD/YdcC
MSWFLATFKDLEDPRTGNATRYRLLDLLTIALTAAICGAESCVEFADFARDRESLFRSFMGLPDTLPSHDTFSRLFRLLDPTVFSRCFGNFLVALGAPGPAQIAIDGKTLRATYEAASGRSALHLLTAFATGQRIALAQCNARGDEISAARTLLELFDVRGVLVSADAVHCQIETAQLIRKRGGHWLFGLKTNRRRLYDEVTEYFADPLVGAQQQWRTVDADHGRIETRLARISHEIDWLYNGKKRDRERSLPAIATIGVVETSVERAGKCTHTVRAYISSATLSAKTFAAAVRAHWMIENGLHWVLDTSFDEDRRTNRKDHGPENLAILRKLALNILRTARPDISIRRKRKRSGWSDEFARTIIGQMR